MRRLEFWYDLASTYSYLSAMRIEALASAADVAIVWRPFLLGPIFAAQGWSTSPFNVYPAKGRYMVRDIERIAASRGLAFRLPEPFPAASLLAARVALVGEEQGWIAVFTRAVLCAEFADGADIADAATLAGVLAGLGIEASPVLERAQHVEIKQRLKTITDLAARTGIFGAPSFVTEDRELFWGDDRLEAAVAWTATI
jgi:2-hydroxychromene-2-carboxylate isomerase